MFDIHNDIIYVTHDEIMELLKDSSEDDNIIVESTRSRIIKMVKNGVQYQTSVDGKKLRDYTRRYFKRFDNDFRLVTHYLEKTNFSRNNNFIDEEKEKFIRKAYLPAIVQNFQIGVFENVNKYDVNSCYPATIIENKFPDGKMQFIDYFSNSKIGIYKIIVILKKEFLFFNWKNMYMPTGEFETFATTEEINYILNKKIGKVKILKGLIWSKNKILKKTHQIIRFLYKKRKESKIYKFVLNSMIGFLARRPGQRMILLKEKGKSYLTPVSMTENKRKNNFMFFPEIPVFVNSYARVKMLKLLHENYSDVIRISTDAIITRRKLNITTSKKIGGFKHNSIKRYQTISDNVFKENERVYMPGTKKVQFKHNPGDIFTVHFTGEKRRPGELENTSLEFTKDTKSRYRKNIVDDLSGNIFTKPYRIEEILLNLKDLN